MDFTTFFIDEKNVNFFPGTAEKRPGLLNGLSHGFFWDVPTNVDPSLFRHIGVLIGFDPDDSGEFLACLDIDGVKSDLAGSRNLLFSVLKDLPIDCVIEETASGGYHIFFKCNRVLDNSHLSIFDFISYPDGTPLGNSLEVFAKPFERYVVVSPTEFSNGKYKLLSHSKDSYKDFEPVANIDDLIVQSLLDNGFIFDSVGFEEFEHREFSEHYELVSFKDTDTDVLSEYIMFCYREGNMNLFAYPLICNFRRAGWTREEVFQIFKNLPIEQDLNKIKSWINDKYTIDIHKIAGFNALQIAIKNYCEEQHLGDTLDYFRSLFNEGGLSNILLQLKEFKNNSYHLHKDTINITYKAKDWTTTEPQGTHEYPLTIKQVGNNEYIYKWGPSTTKIYPTFITTEDKKRNQSILNIATRAQIKKDKHSIQNFLKALTKQNLSELENHLDYNYRLIQKYYEKLQEKQRLSDAIRITNNEFIINDIEKKRIYRNREYITKEGNIETKLTQEYTGFAIKSIEQQTDILQKEDTNTIITILTPTQEEEYEFTNIEEFTTQINKKASYSMVSKFILRDIISRIILHFKEEDKIKNTKRGSINGIFKVNNTIQLIRNNKLENPQKQNIQEALDILNEFYEVNNIKDKTKFIAIYRWFLLAPFSYILRENVMDKRNLIKLLFLFGSRDTAKSTLCEIFQLMWKQPPLLEAGAFAANPYRLGEILKKDGFPAIIDECGEVFEEIELRNMIKISSQHIYSRKKQIDNKFQETPCYSGMTFTDNEPIDIDQASIAKRFLIIEFSKEDIPTQEQLEKYNKIFNAETYEESKFTKLSYIADYFYLYVKENLNTFLKNHEQVLNDFLKHLIDEYNPNMTYLLHPYKGEDIIKKTEISYKQAIMGQIRFDFNTIDRIDTNLPIDLKRGPTFKEKLKYLIQNKRIPYLHYKYNTDEVIISTSINKKLKKYGYNFDQMTTKGLTDLFNSTQTHRIGKDNKKRVDGAKITLDELCYQLED